jgi:hypothetical protein
MNAVVSHARLNIYLDDPELRTRIRIAAASDNVSLSAYCLEAIRRRLAQDGLQSESEPIKPSASETHQVEAPAAFGARTGSVAPPDWARRDFGGRAHC